MIISFLLVGTGGAIGACFRLLVSTASKRLLGKAFPWGTFIINIIGSFVIGFIAAKGLGNKMELFFMTGMLGGFTTFSTFNYEAVNLLKSKYYFRFAAYVIGTYVICMCMTGIGFCVS